MSFFNELKRRNVFRVAIGYIVSSWLLLQVADLVLENIGAPGWVIQTIMLVITLGFPVVVFFSWAYEVTPEGIKRETEIDRGQSITHITGRKLDYSILAVLVLALAYFIWESRFSNRAFEATERLSKKTVAEDQAIAASGRSPESLTTDHLSIAVLPFENRSNRDEDQFFTDGVHYDLLTTIARIGSMKVISRRSVMEYRNTTKKLPVIAKELGVANILEGGIQRSGNQVRINVQLIDANTDEHLWAEIFDREISANNLFAIQSEISKAIADALQATLSPDELRRIDTKPTDDLVAYDAYFRGRQLMATRKSENLELAIEAFNKAVELDPQFALAWVGVAESNALLPRYGTTLTAEAAIPIRENAINRALAIDKNLGEAYTSLGYLLSDKNKYAEAEAAYKKAIELSPNYATTYHWYGILISRFITRIEEYIQLSQKAAELDPRAPVYRSNLAYAYRARGLYSMAEDQFLKLIDLKPKIPIGYSSLAEMYIYSMGEYEQALAYSIKALELDPNSWSVLFNLLDVYLELDDLAAADQIRERLSELNVDAFQADLADVKFNLYKDNPTRTRESIDSLLPKIKGNLYLTMNLGTVDAMLGNKHRARETYLSAAPGWLVQDQWQDLIDLYDYHGCMMSWVLINTGDADLGQQLLQETTTFMDEKLSANYEPTKWLSSEMCYLTAGDTEKALRSIETQLNHNRFYGWKIFHQSPMFDLIRHEPRYQAALAERNRRVAVQREAIYSERDASE